MSRVKGFKHSEETKRKISEANRGKKNGMYGRKVVHSEETRRKLSIANMGKNHSQAARKKMSESRRGKKLSEDHKRNIGLGIKDRIISNAHKRKISDSLVDHIVTKETRRKIRNSLKGEKSPRWLGGISFEPHGIEFDHELKEKIRARDNYTCQLCMTAEITRKHDVHHIDYDKKNNSDDNLITLCRSCHARTNVNRSYWRSFLYFAEPICSIGGNCYI